MASGSIVTFLPIQQGEGTPSLTNVRPIKPRLYIDGIGAVYGGELDPDNGILNDTYAYVLLDGNVGVNDGRYNNVDRDLIGGGWVYCTPGTTSTVMQNTLICDKLNYTKNSDLATPPFIKLSSAGTAYFMYRLDYISNHPELDYTNRTEVINFCKEWFRENPVAVCYRKGTPTTYHLTAPQLQQAIQQLGLQMPSALEKRRSILLNTPHLITPAAAELHTFNTDMVAPLKECRVHFSPVQAGTGDPSPDNVRPISGWTGFTFYKCGKNLTLAKDGTTMLTLPNYTSANKGDIIRGFPTDEDFVLSCKVSTGIGVNSSRRLYLYGITTSNKFLNTGIVQDGSNKVVNKPTELGTLVVWHNRNGLNDVGEYLYDIQLERGTTPTAYEEYNGIRQEIDWTSIGEIPGGYIDLVNGEIVEEWKKLNVANASISLNTALADVDRWYFGVSDFINTTITAAPEIMTNIYKPYNLVDANNNKMNWVVACQSRTLYFYTPPGTYNNKNEFVSGLQDSSIVYKLAEPIHHPIDPVTLKTLRGINNIWSNANGNIELSYWKH